jgi:Domain of unknown function (DUF5658)
MQTRQRQRYGVGLVEVIPEPIRFARLRANLASCRTLIFAVLLAQAEDGMTTYVAITRGQVEANPLLRLLTGSSPAAALALKLALVLAVVTIALSRLPLGRARAALTVALGLSLLGPVANTLTLLFR